ncbi:VOC family protein [Glycomyces sp. TRM65418]|uniref:VOC family protein n=1 Tax=Glycomyces sp. TRM65418 TaxID=2867006 RepID=UPI001CE5E155|nr:VOC family protein [Glycomyces sp. TRM65418]MCC3765241.1 VOC family protein [Glycomyces sp. TRM65418]QZD54862.1 VOC family protein [Glycomyces sp. TRM65418]
MSTEPRTDAKVDPIPDGYHSIVPFIVVNEAAKAIEFYEHVFGAKVLMRNDGPDGSVVHCDLKIGDSVLQLGDANPQWGLEAPNAERITGSTSLYVEDCDAVFAKAVEAGATVREEPSVFLTSDRYASIADPFGRRWSIMTRVEDVSHEEAQRRIDEWIASMSEG